MIIWSFLACADPSLLDGIAAELGRRSVDDARLGVQMTVGVMGLLAEACSVDVLNEHTFVSPTAARMGVTTVGVVVDPDAGGITWTFTDVAPLWAPGLLVVGTQSNRASFDVEWIGNGQSLSGTLTNEGCSSDGAAATFAGALTHLVGAEDRRTLTALGAAPVSGLRWAPALADVPGAGQLRWQREEDEHNLLLDDASSIMDTWPGVASGNTWESAVELDPTPDPTG